jgi:hypothetical protein
MIRSILGFLVLVLLFTILNVMDGHSTFLVVSNSNLRSERNPFARFLFRKLGLKTGIITLKSFSILIIPLAYIFIKDLRSELTFVLLVANAFYIVVVWNNYRNYRRILKHKIELKKFEKMVQSIKEN